MVNRKIGLVLTYFNREIQVKESVKSIGKSKHDNYHIIIVDDNSDVELDVNELKQNINKNCDISILRINKDEKFWNNPVIVYNKGIEKAIQENCEIVVLQNSESYHFGDVLSYVNEHLTDDNYISFGCFSIDENLMNNSIGDYESKLPTVIGNCTHSLQYDGQTSWYNHPIYRAAGYDFCSAITTKNLIKLNGFDERYSTCIWFGDDDFKFRVELIGLKIYITKYPEEPIVIHQWHDHNYTQIPNEFQCKANGRVVYDSVVRSRDYIAKHLITKNFN